MNLLFCADPLNPRQPDLDYADEVAAATQLGFTYELINFEALVEGDLARAVRRVAARSAAEIGIYRGWMLRPEQYTSLYDALAERNLYLLNDPAAYTHCHYLPESYAIIEQLTPRSVWLKTGSDIVIDQIMALLRPFGARPIIVKDFVKSRKHEWAEACYIPSAADREAVERVVRRFLELQAEDLNVGLVFREFIVFEPLVQHSRSGMPLTQEFRLFVLDGRPIFSAEYWEEGDYAEALPPIDHFRATAAAVSSRFFTMDIAKRIDGKWMIVELGDAQVAGLPERADILRFYEALAGNWPHDTQGALIHDQP